MTKISTYPYRSALASCLLLAAASLAGCDQPAATSTANSVPATTAQATTKAAPPQTASPKNLPAGALLWPIDNLDSIGGTKPTILGAPKLISDPSGKSLSFNGTNDGIILPVTPLAGMKTFTLQVLFKPESGGPAEQRFIHSEDQAGNRMTVETRLTPDGKWSLDTFLLAGDNSSRRSLLDTTKLHPADQWYWVALRYDGTTMSHYINAVKELEGPVTFPPMAATGRISLGVRLNQVNWFKGQIRELRITPRVLTEAELQKLP